MSRRGLTAGRTFSPLCSLLAVLLLAACATDQTASQGGGQVTVAAKPAAPVQPEPAVIGSGGLTLPREEARDRPSVLPEPAPNAAPPELPHLQQLVGMNRGGLSDLLGKPSLLRREPPAEVWQYSAAQCVLHVFFYSDTDNGGYRVSHVDIVRRPQQRVARLTQLSATASRQYCSDRALLQATAQNLGG